ncbi:hypothetical protein F5Y16DRAFT_381957 [Xylariaceae sp. FL0255]|nr:hypothetical protein F5Y16DRAFT_381957 [Xylariaceae sp. FL0255]
MATRFKAARPKREGEKFARQHHQNNDNANNPSEPSTKKVKFDTRNPSALAASAADDDSDGVDQVDEAFLAADADVIRGSAATKRGAVNIDGYESDSDREELGASRAADKIGKNNKSKKKNKKDDDSDEDMFAAGSDVDEKEDGEDDDDRIDKKTGKRSKEVRFVNTDAIQGQVNDSKSGGEVGDINFHAHPNIKSRRPGQTPDDDEEESDEETIALAIQEEAIDEEVGLGGLKRHAPKLEAFNLKQEGEEGRFDEAGNFVRRAADPDAVHDRWLEGVSKKDMRRAAEAHEKRAVEERAKRREDEDALTTDLLRSLILNLDRGETALEALQRLGGLQNRLRKKKTDVAKAKKVPKWKQKKKSEDDNVDTEAMDVDTKEKGKEKEKDEDPELTRIKTAVETITDAADKLLRRDRPDIYDRERELLIREYTRESDEEWVEPRITSPSPAAADSFAGAADVPSNDGGGGKIKMWEYRWTDGRDGAAKQGPYDGNMMKAWQDAGYFGQGVEFREVGDESWSRVVDFI